MTRGRVSGHLDLQIPLSLVASGAQIIVVDATIDTGFTGFLTLPPNTIAGLGLAPTGTVTARLADGTTIQRPNYKGRIEWEGVHRIIDVMEVEGDPLVGMLLLYDSRLTIDVVAGGDVNVEPLP
jgi:clan AA aspartic protease